MSRILWLDVGDVRVGIAMTDPLKIISSPFKIVDTKKENFVLIFKEILNEYFIEKVIYGLPKSLDGKERRQAEKVNIFINNLKKVFEKIIFIPIDERYTTTMAISVLKEKGFNSKEQRFSTDSISASIILQ